MLSFCVSFIFAIIINRVLRQWEPCVGGGFYRAFRLRLPSLSSHLSDNPIFRCVKFVGLNLWLVPFYASLNCGFESIINLGFSVTSTPLSHRKTHDNNYSYQLLLLDLAIFACCSIYIVTIFIVTITIIKCFGGIYTCWKFLGFNDAW